ncbi:MAG: hypothetical protein ACR2HM_05225 [Acidimicrobiales bacterium]
MLVGVVGAAFADSYEPVLPPFPDPRFIDPQLLVTPSDNLASGQTVSVTGRRFGADATGGTLRQCTTDLSLCEAPTGSFTTGSNGEFNPVGAPLTPNDPSTIPVDFVVRAAFISTGGQPVNCLVTTCVILANMTVGNESRSGAHHIAFTGAVTTSSTSTTTSTSTTLPTTTTTLPPTTTTLPPTTTTLPPTTSTTLAATTTTTLGTEVCDALRASRVAANAALDAAAAANPSQSATIERYRTDLNARIDAELARRGCTTPG